MINYILHKLIIHNVITNTEKEIYQYGIIVILFNLLILTSFTIVGLSLGRLYDVILFLIFFIPIRIMLGGYHCKKPWNCFFVSNLFLLIVLLLIPYFKSFLTIITSIFIVSLFLRKDRIPFFNCILYIIIFFYILGIINFQVQQYINLSFLSNMILYYITIVANKAIA